MVKIIHFHPETKCNKGDMAIAMSIEDLLKENIKVTKYTHCCIEDLKKMESPRIIDLTSKGPRGSKIVPMFFPFKHFYKFLRNKQVIGLIKKINNYDLLIMGGGGIYSDFFFPLDKKIISEVNIPIVIFSPGININLNAPQLSEEVKESIIYLNKKSRLSSVRDSNTKRVLNSWGLKTENIGDPAIHLKTKEDNLKLDRDKLKIGINFACHTKYSDNDNFNKLFDFYVNLIKRISKDNKIELIYFQHHPKEKRLIKLFRKQFPFMKVVDQEPRKLKNAYSKIDLMISMMLHSTIFAFSNNIHFVNVAYNKKNNAFMEDIGQKKNVIQMENLPDIEKFYKKLEKLLNVKNPHRRNKEKYTQKMNQFLVRLNQQVSSK